MQRAVARDLSSSGLPAATVVENLAALKALTSRPATVRNKDRATVNDGGGGVWTFRTGNQSANVTADPLSGVWAAPDSAPTGASGAWQRLYDGGPWAAWWGVDAAASAAANATALQAAATAAIALGAKKLNLPYGSIAISSAITVTAPIVFDGYGPTATIIRQTSSTADGIVFNYAALTQGGGVRNLTIEAGAGWQTAGYQGTGSSGIGLKVVNSNGKFVADNYGFHNFATGCAMLGSWYVELSFSGEIMFNATAGVFVDDSALGAGGGCRVHTKKISNNGFTGVNTASVGIHVVSCGGFLATSSDITGYNQAVLGKPTAGKQVYLAKFISVLADTSVTDGFVFDGTAGGVISTTLIDCNGEYSTNGAGLVTKGALLDGLWWLGGALRENGTNGWNHKGGTNVDVEDCEIASNSKLTSNTYDGVLIDANVSKWSLTDSRVGNFASSLTGQANNITISAGTSQDFTITGNDLRDWGAGKTPIANGSSSANYVITSNLPLATAGVNIDRGEQIHGCTKADIASGSTVYLGCNAEQAAELDTTMVVGRGGLLSQVVTQVSVAPGAGETYAYTVMKNSVATSMIGTISGGASFQAVVTANPVTLAATDTISLKLVTSAGASIGARHRWVMSIDP